MRQRYKASMVVNMRENQWPNNEKFLNDEQFPALVEKITPCFVDLLAKERIDTGMVAQLENVYLPLAAWVAQKHTDNPVVIGLNGAQGSGKSTLSKILQVLLSQGFGKKVTHFSIDDLYLSRAERKSLADKVHPLFQVRGVPGTHDVELGKSLISSLSNENPEFPLLLPVFDKAQDDLLKKTDWQRVNEQADVILFEGWCVGARPQKMHELTDPVNELERNEDMQGVWRRYVNEQLAGPYQELFGFIDYLVMLKVPDMDSVFKWRNLQEKKLKDVCRNEDISTAKVMSESEVARFIMHYERITQSILEEMPGRADVVLSLDKKHQIAGIKVSA